MGYIFKSIHINIHLYIHIYIYVYIHIYMYTYINIYIGVVVRRWATERRSTYTCSMPLYVPLEGLFAVC
jgi:hypothetical protein